jgi:[acyl-carrier-protein] S-malonyltransferase
MAMQRACEERPSSMAAILGMDDNIVEEICASISEIVIPANYNSPGQIVISGSNEGIDKAIEILKEKGAKRAIKLPVGGAFHSPLMEPARLEFEEAVINTSFNTPVCPVYQNVNAQPSVNPDVIKANLVSQLTSPVLWTQIVVNMISDGATSFTEVGPGNVLQGLIKKINKDISTESAKY